MVQLLLGRWCEPPEPSQLHLSTLVQQILSVIAQHGGATARDLYSVLCQTGPFRGLDSETFAQLLRCLGEGYILTQTSDRALALGDRGEKLVDHYSFYAAFVTPEEYRLVVGSRALGTMPIAQPLVVGGYLIFAGQRWEIRHIDEAARVIELSPAKGGRVPRFEGGGFDVHDRVRTEMAHIYASSAIPVYLDATAKELLVEGREAFRRWGLAESRWIESAEAVQLFPWIGDRALHTLALQLVGMQLAASVEGIAITVRSTSTERLTEALENISMGKAPVGRALARLAQNQIEEKYDWALTPDLRCLDYASRHFDEAGSRKAAGDILLSLRSTSI
jgi:ATP-dependent Lhr-like helicase